MIWSQLQVKFMVRQFFRLILWFVGLTALAVWLLVWVVSRFENSSGSLADITRAPVTAQPPGETSSWLDRLGQLATSVAAHNLDVMIYALLILVGIGLLLRPLIMKMLGASRGEPSARAPSDSGQSGATGSLMRASAYLPAARPDRDRTISVGPMIRSYPSSLASGLTGRMTWALAGAVALFGVVSLCVIYFTVTASLHREEMRRAAVIAVNASDVAAPFVVGKKPDPLRALLRKQATRQGVAYILIQDREGGLFAHSLAVLPDELQTPVAASQPQIERALKVGAAWVYETTVPVLEGRIGLVRVGLWRDSVDGEIAQTVGPMVRLVLAVIVAGLVLAVLLVWRINRPILRLVRISRSISLGDLDIPLSGNHDRGEYGELSRAMERLRSSVRAAMVRLSER